MVCDKFGPPSLIKGVQTYQNNAIVNRNEEIGTGKWRERIRRAGAIARKIGVVPLWQKDGTQIYTTMLQVELLYISHFGIAFQRQRVNYFPFFQIVDNHVVKYIPPESYTPARERLIEHRRKFGCLLVGAESQDPSYFTKEYCGMFTDSGVMPKKLLSRFYINTEAYIPPGTPINASHFSVDDYVDVRGKT